MDIILIRLSDAQLQDRISGCFHAICIVFQELKELLDLISNCGYFEKVNSIVEPTTESGDVEFEVVEHKDVPAPDSEEVQSSLPPEIIKEETEPETLNAGQPLINNDALNTQPPVCILL